MLPLGNRPVVDYAVQDCIAAGIRDIYFVVSEQSTQIRDFYRSNVDLNNYLRRNGKADLLPLIAPPKVNLHYMVQSSYGKYGTAIPVSLVVPQLDPGEPVVVLMGDDCVYNADGTSEVARLIEAAGEDRSAILGVHMPPDQLSHYGVLDVADDGRLRGVVEKPAPGKAPSEMINVSKYVLSALPPTPTVTTSRANTTSPTPSTTTSPLVATWPSSPPRATTSTLARSRPG